MAQVIKKDNSQEDFDRDKVVSALLNAGASEDEAEDIAVKVEDWLEEAGMETVSSSEIKEKVLGWLQESNPAAVETFRSYQKPS